MFAGQKALYNSYCQGPMQEQVCVVIDRSIKLTARSAKPAQVRPNSVRDVLKDFDNITYITVESQSVHRNLCFVQRSSYAPREYYEISHRPDSDDLQSTTLAG